MFDALIPLTFLLIFVLAFLALGLSGKPKPPKQFDTGKDTIVIHANGKPQKMKGRIVTVRENGKLREAIILEPVEKETPTPKPNFWKVRQ